VGEIPSILTGLGIAVCGYCGGAVVSQNLMGRKRQADGRPQPGHRRLACTTAANGRGCPVGGSIQAAPVERALMLYAADSMRMEELASGGDHGQGLRADLAKSRRRLSDTEARLDRLARALAEDEGAAPITVMRQIRALETDADAERAAITAIEDTVTVSIRMTTTQRARLALLGGAAWVRRQIDKTKPNDSQPKGE
jgi:hypothetical protein